MSSEPFDQSDDNPKLKKGLPTGGRSGTGNIVQSKAANAKPPSAVVACAVKRAPKKSAMNAGKFSGGNTDYYMQSEDVVVQILHFLCLCCITLSTYIYRCTINA